MWRQIIAVKIILHKLKPNIHNNSLIAHLYETLHCYDYTFCSIVFLKPHIEWLRQEKTATMHAKILVVDDEEMIRENLKAYLEDEGFAVTAVESGEQALHCLRSGCTFSVCIMDMRLPGIDGNSCIRNMHALCPNMGFLVHTGSSDYSLPDDLQTIGLHAQQVYLKPMADMAALAEEIRTLIKSGRDPE